MKSKYGSTRGLVARELGATVVEYTLMVGIIATVGIVAIRTLGDSLASTVDPCKPGALVRAAQILGGQAAGGLQCDEAKKL